MTDVRWEIVQPGLRIDGDDVVWAIRNTSDEEDAPAGLALGTVSIWRRQEANSVIDSTPYTNEITLDRDVAAGTAHPMSYPLTWQGQESGAYTVLVTHHDDLTADLLYRKTEWEVVIDNW
ncbi:MAG: hypothetical protein H0W25_15890 [Acidimicrobiia bacterium]|nr:hypothetical protein [Acidimicrobiia bacterium]